MKLSKLTTRVAGLLTVCPINKAFVLCEEGTSRIIPLNIGDILIADDWRITADPGVYKMQGEDDATGHMVEMPAGHFAPQLFLKTLPHPDAEKLGMLIHAYVEQQTVQLELKNPILANPAEGSLGSIEPNKAHDLREKLHWRLFRNEDETLLIEEGDTLTLLNERGETFWSSDITATMLKGMEAGFKKLPEKLPEWDILFNAMRTGQRAILRKN